VAALATQALCKLFFFSNTVPLNVRLPQSFFSDSERKWNKYVTVLIPKKNYKCTSKYGNVCPAVGNIGIINVR
jgi:hypothetical protein